MIIDRHTAFTPLRFYPRLSRELGIELWVKHDDEFQGAGGGNKVRKLGKILNEAERQGCNAIVTAGGANSNHVRAAALLAAQRGWLAHAIIHAEPPAKLRGNLLLANLAGATLRFCTRETVAQRMDAAMAVLSSQGRKPYYIWGGGHTRTGGLAYFDAARELSIQCDSLAVAPTHVVVASGTGTTLAGLALGGGSFLPDTQFHGVSVAHDHQKGIARVLEAIAEINPRHDEGRLRRHLSFYDTFLCGGYECVNMALWDILRWGATTEGLVLDPTYTGKAFMGLKSLVQEGKIAKGSTVCFWHTGGGNNLQTAEPLA